MQIQTLNVKSVLKPFVIKCPEASPKLLPQFIQKHRCNFMNELEKNPPLNRPSKYKPPRDLYLEIALKYKGKQIKNGKFPSNYKASPIDFESQISLDR